MKIKGLILIAATMVLAGCPDDTKKAASCTPNATGTTLQTDFYEDVVVNNQQIVVADATYVRNEGNFKFTLESGTEVDFDSSEGNNPENDDDTVIDFSSMMMSGTDENDQPISIDFVQDLTASDEAGMPVFNVNSDALLAMARESLSLDVNSEVQVCSIASAAYTFAVDPDTDEMTMQTEFVFNVQVSSELAAFWEDNYGGGESPGDVAENQE